MYNLASRLKDGGQFINLWELLKQIEKAEMAYIDDAARYLLASLNSEPAGVNHIRRRDESGVVLPLDTKTRLHLLDQLNIFARHATLFDADGMANDDAQPTFERFGCYASDIYPLLASHDVAVSLPGDEGSDERVFPDGKRVPGSMLAYDYQAWISLDRAIKVLIAGVSDAKRGSPKYEDVYETWEAALSDAIERAAISVTTISGRRMLSHPDIHTWCTQHSYFWPLDSSTAPQTDASEVVPEIGVATKPLQRQAYQEQEILRVLAELGHDPQKLPVSPAGQPGVKAEVRSTLNWQGSTVFDKAWERLRGRKEIADAQ